MVHDLLVFADIFLRVLSGGTESWEEVGYRFHEMGYKTLEACEEDLERYADRIADFLEDEAREWWMQELNVDDRDLRIETSAECVPRPS